MNDAGTLACFHEVVVNAQLLAMVADYLDLEGPSPADATRAQAKRRDATVASLALLVFWELRSPDIREWASFATCESSLDQGRCPGSSCSTAY